MDTLFKITYDILKFLETITGFSYREINIIIWFFIIPFSWAILLDILSKKHYFKMGSIAIISTTLLLINDFKSFCNWLFDKSVDFLNVFNAVGSNYIASSVIICVFIPLVIYALLIRKVVLKRR